MNAILKENTLAPTSQAPLTAFADLDRDLQLLAGNRQRWVQTPVAERIAILAEIKDALMPVAQAWAETAARKKGIAEGSALVGEEWLSGPYAMLTYCNQMMETLSKVQGKHHLDHLAVRQLPNGQVAARVLPASIWDHLLLSGVKVDVWMQPGVTLGNLAQNTAGLYDPARCGMTRKSASWCWVRATSPRLHRWMCCKSCTPRTRWSSSR